MTDPIVKLSIITPCYRQHNLEKCRMSIQFDLIDKWYIVYDTSKNRSYNKLYTDHPKIQELECSGGISGNPQRNLGIDQVKDGFIYFLDDDNMVHLDFWSILPTVIPDRFYTWDGTRCSGSQCKVAKIDTAMYMVPKSMVGDLRWKESLYEADGVFIEEIYKRYPDKHVYIPRLLAYYNIILK